MILHLPIPEPVMTARERVNWFLSCLIAQKQIARRQAQPHVAIWLDCNGIELWCGHFDEIRMNG